MQHVLVCYLPMPSMICDQELTPVAAASVPAVKIVTAALLLRSATCTTESGRNQQQMRLVYLFWEFAEARNSIES